MVGSRLDDEGLLIPPTRLLSGGRLRRDVLDGSVTATYNAVLTDGDFSSTMNNIAWARANPVADGTTAKPSVAVSARLADLLAVPGGRKMLLFCELNHSFRAPVVPYLSSLNQ